MWLLIKKCKHVVIKTKAFIYNTCNMASPTFASCDKLYTIISSETLCTSLWHLALSSNNVNISC